MSTDYPGALDSFTTWVDGVDTVTAAQVNNLQDSVLAVETALGTDPAGSAASVGAALLDRVSKSGDTMSGDLSMGGNRITNVAAPEDDFDAANRSFVEDAVNPVGVRWRDDFLGDKAAQWTLAGTGGTYTQNAELAGTGDLSTGATSGNSAGLSFAGKGCVDVTKEPNLITRAKIDSDTEIFAVLAGLYGGANDLVEIYYDATATPGNFKYRCKSGGTESSVDSGVAADSGYHVFEIEVEGSEVHFLIDDGNEETIVSNVPGVLLEPRVLVETRENANKVLTVDIVHLEADR